MTDFVEVVNPEFPSVEILDDILSKPSNSLTLAELSRWYCVIEYTANTAQILLPWPTMKRLVMVLFSLTLNELVVSKKLVLPEPDSDISEKAVLLCIDIWKSPPFTLQRLCELLQEQLDESISLKMYSNPMAFLFAVVKCTVGITDTQHRSTQSTQPIINPADYVYFDKNYKQVALHEEDAQILLSVDRANVMRVKGVGPLKPRHEVTSVYSGGDYNDNGNLRDNEAYLDDTLTGNSDHNLHQISRRTEMSDLIDGDATETPKHVSSLDLITTHASNMENEEDLDLFSPAVN